MNQTAPTKQDVAGEWKAALDNLVDQIEDWSTQARWTTARQRKMIRERGVGRYFATDLNIKTPWGVLVFDVRARDTVDSQGRVDFYLLQNLHEAIMIRRDGQWVLESFGPERRRRRWNKRTFLELPKLLAAE